MENPRIGDLVKIINYGNLCFINKSTNPKPNNFYKETDIAWWHDISPELVGQKAIISNIDGRGYVSLILSDTKRAWFNPKTQLELVRQNPNSEEDLI